MSAQSNAQTKLAEAYAAAAGALDERHREELRGLLNEAAELIRKAACPDCPPPPLIPPDGAPAA